MKIIPIFAAMLKCFFIGFFLFLSAGLLAAEQDTLRSKRALKERIAEQDTARSRILKEWTLSSDFSEEISIPFDTVFSLSNRFKIADKFSPVNASPGNYGLPFYQINFFDRVTDPDKFLYTYYYPFMFVPDRALFMNTQVPFTEINWSFAGPRETAEQTFRVRHSQNVNRFLNFGLIYDIIFSLGQYNYQRADNKDFIFYSSYTGDKYKLYFAGGINNILSFENGGIISNDLIGTVDNTRDIPVNLGGTSNAKSLLKNRSLLLVQRYTLGGNTPDKKDTTRKEASGFLGLSGTFSHILTLETNKRSYSDEYPISEFYDTILINNSLTFDSLFSRNVKNTIRFDFTTDESRKFRFGGGAGIRNEIFRYSQIIPVNDTLDADTVKWNRSNNAIIGKLYNNIGDKFRWLASGELYLTGYRAGDFTISGSITKGFDWKKGRATWIMNGDMSSRQPSFWYQQWGSNHFKWNRNLDKEFRINLGTRFSYPARNADIKFNYAIIDNYTGFDTTAHPFQHPGGLSVAALSISKELKAWKFHLASDVIIQKSSNQRILDLPLVTIRSAGYFEHLFRFSSTGGSLNTQLGVDVTYHTLYHPYAYMPATGRYYLQESSRTGNYPFVNAFLNFKVRRTRVFIMFDHLNAGLKGTDYSMIPSYPMNIRMLRYGIAWTFYD